MTADTGLHVEDRPDHIRVLTLQGPGRRNALREETLDALDRALDATPRAFLLRAEGPAFCAGSDLTQLPEATPNGPLPDARVMAVIDKLRRLPIPTVAVVQGPAIGAGCDLAVACDFRLGTVTASFAMPPIKLGLIYAPEGVARLTDIIGTARARWMFLAGRKVLAEQAFAWGLLQELHPDVASAQSAAFALCSELAASAPLAVKGTKKTFLGEPGAMLETLRREAFLSEDLKEGQSALLAKRTPVFRGR